MRRLLALILAAVASAAGVAGAQPATVTRVLRTIDFEERRLGNDEDLPMHWVKVEAPGFPHYLAGRLTTDRAHGGEHSFRFDLNGGSLLYRYEPRQIKVTRGACYRVEGWVQTTVLAHARARITAYFTDADGHPIAASLRHSEPYAATADGEPWRHLSFDVTATAEVAAYLTIELELLQPQVYAPGTLGAHTLYPQDIRGSAWFDDITVAQVPRVNLTTGRPGNLFHRGEPVSLVMELHDPFTEDLAAQMLVRDAEGRAVCQRSGAADLSNAVRLGPVQLRVPMPLPDLPPGWYEVTVAMSSQGRPLGSHTLRFVRLADDAAPGAPDDRFGLIATDLPFETWADLPALLPHLGVGRVKLGVWSKTADAERLDPAAFDNVMAALHELQIRPTACLMDLPPTITRKLDERQQALGATPMSNVAGASWLRLLKAKDDDWQPLLEDLIARHSTHLDRWQLGADGTDAFVVLPAMRQVYAMVHAKFATLLRQPDLAMPWPAWYELDGNLPATVALSVPSNVLPSQLPLYIQDLRGIEGHHLSLSLQLLDRDRYGRDVQLRDLAQRVIYALAAGAERIDLPSPFTVMRPAEGTEGDTSQHPQDIFPVMHTLLTTLSHAKYAGRVPVADGIEAFLFTRPGGQGVLALWDTGRAGAALRALPINLGDSPRMTDLFGNDIPLVRPRANDPASGTVQLVVGPMPVFLTHIDGSLAMLRASVAIDRPLIESTFAAHARHVRFTNTYNQPITGSLKLKAPDGWTITPSLHSFSLNPGEAFDHEVTIEFPVSSAAGPRTIEAQFIIQSDKPAAFHMPLEVKLGLSDIGMQSMAFRDGPDVLIQQVIHNYGDRPIDYSAFALFPGQQRQERLVANLGPGQSVAKRYRFPNAKVPAAGTTARVGIKEIDGTRVLNDELQIR